MPRSPRVACLTGLLMLAAALTGTAATAAPKPAQGPDWALARTAFAGAPPLELDENLLFACSATWNLWMQALEGGTVKVPAGALPPQLLGSKASDTAADWGLYLIDSDKAFEAHKLAEKQLTPELTRARAGDAKATRAWFTRLGTCKVPE